MSEKPEVTALRKKLGDECKERDELLKQLDMSLDLQALWPDVFEGEKPVTAVLTGNPQNPATMRFKIVREGDDRDFKLSEVPEALLAFHIDQIKDGHLQALVKQYVDMLHGKPKRRSWNRR